ncbi:Uncharacterised protein [Nocardia otitidiscaviarum]|uniref:Uncharacterized protein n=1 Tax=Nocardia otitidiscaviarum TaxID=1823 RepID=A0A378YVE9_9NOCA|nr:hypothetical protein [Nocardia otitidiscaviarum]SUA81146.1 Uncharacterised protein [Nocardia otitidiscaviarum]
MSAPDSSRLRAVWKPLRIPLILIALYLALYPIAAALSARHGFGSPDGIGIAYPTVTSVLVCLRMVLLVAVPAILAYRLAAHLATRALLRIATDPTSKPPDPALSTN